MYIQAVGWGGYWAWPQVFTKRFCHQSFTVVSKVGLPCTLSPSSTDNRTKKILNHIIN